LSIEGVLPYAPTTQYAVAANAAFITLDRAASLPLSAGTPLAGANLDTVAGWNTKGSVDIAPASTGSTLTASATLNEVSGSQTRLSQVCVLDCEN
jgi:hypothetical protein